MSTCKLEQSREREERRAAREVAAKVSVPQNKMLYGAVGTNGEGAVDGVLKDRNGFEKAGRAKRGSRNVLSCRAAGCGRERIFMCLRPSYGQLVQLRQLEMSVECECSRRMELDLKPEERAGSTNKDKMKVKSIKVREPNPAPLPWLNGIRRPTLARYQALSSAHRSMHLDGQCFCTACSKDELNSWQPL